MTWFWLLKIERDDVLFTTGNTSDGVVSEPVPNHGLSMMSVEARSGAINWQFQPVPFALDDARAPDTQGGKLIGDFFQCIVAEQPHVTALRAGPVPAKRNAVILVTPAAAEP